MSGSTSSGVSSGTIRQSSLPRASSSSECCTQTTGTCSRRALSTRRPMFATTASRSCAPATTPFCTSTTRSAVFGRFSSVVMVAPCSTPRQQRQRTGSTTSMARRPTAVDAQGLAGDERRPFQVEDPVDDVTDAADRVTSRDLIVGRRVVHWSLDDPGATALTRTPRVAYSAARARVTASSPPLVSDVSADGRSRSGWSTRLVVMLTMWPPP